MPFKDKAKEREYQRNYQRLRRAGLSAGERRLKVLQISNLPSSPEETETARGLLSILGHLIGEVLTTDQGDIFMRSRTAGYLISIGLRAVEVADLESRLTNLESKVIGVQK